MEKTLKVEGMMCPRCKAHVEKACKSVEGVIEATADVEKGNVVIKLDNENLVQTVINSIKEEGYEAYL